MGNLFWLINFTLNDFFISLCTLIMILFLLSSYLNRNFGREERQVPFPDKGGKWNTGSTQRSCSGIASAIMENRLTEGPVLLCFFMFCFVLLFCFVLVFLLIYVFSPISCFCKELGLGKTVVIAGTLTEDGNYLLDESSYVRHASEHLLKKVQERTKQNRCRKTKKQE